MKLRYYILIGLAILAMGFGLGRWAMPTPEPEVKYVELPAVSGSVKPFELKPISSNLTRPLRFIYVYSDEPSEVNSMEPEVSYQEPEPNRPIDTLESYRKTILDWNLARTFKATLFDTPELGRFNYTATVQYNTLLTFDWEYSPVQRTETVVKPRRVVEPFVRVSYNTFDQYTAGGGVYYKGVGLEAFYIRDVRADKKGFGGALSFKF